MPIYESKVRTNTMSIITGRYRVSIIWGSYTYSDNHWHFLPIDCPEPVLDSRTAEVAVILREKEGTKKWAVTKKFWKCFDSVAGYLSVDEVLTILGKVALKSKDNVLLEFIRNMKPVHTINQLRKELEIFSDSGIIDGTCRHLNNPMLESPNGD